jgi:hypothetical protein
MFSPSGSTGNKARSVSCSASYVYKNSEIALFMACYLLKPTGYCYDPPRRTFRKLFFPTAGCVYVFFVVLTQKSDCFCIHC